jgi:hypothetical protein
MASAVNNVILWRYNRVSRVVLRVLRTAPGVMQRHNAVNTKTSLGRHADKSSLETPVVKNALRTRITCHSLERAESKHSAHSGIRTLPAERRKCRCKSRVCMYYRNVTLAATCRGTGVGFDHQGGYRLTTGEGSPRCRHGPSSCAHALAHLTALTREPSIV